MNKKLQKCGAVGAKLASIHSVEEQAFITGQINVSFFFISFFYFILFY